MWQLDNRTPFAAERSWVRDRNGAEVWLVAVKCTFDILPDGSTRVSEEQPPVLRVPKYNGEPGKSSVRFESDLVLTKTTTDVILAGAAYAPAERAVQQMEVAFTVGPVRKTLRIVGDRVWRGSSASSPEPFLRMPIVYERAYGGVDTRSGAPERHWDWRNPVGTGFSTARQHLDGVPLPNIEYPEEGIRAWSDRPRPAGFGPIAGHWQPRVRLAGTYDDEWSTHRQPLVPDDFDDRFFQCAPADQQAPAFLRGGEPVVLEGLTRYGGTLRFSLPKIFLGLDTRFDGGGREIHQDRKLHTVILEPDVPRVSLVYHSALPCHFKVHKLHRTILTLRTPISRPESTVEADA